jgi:hypothetical protein
MRRSPERETEFFLPSAKQKRDPLSLKSGSSFLASFKLQCLNLQ